MSQYAYVSLSLIGLCALAGAGVGVGSGVAMMYSQMAQAEQEQKTGGAVAHSPGSFPWGLLVFLVNLSKRCILKPVCVVQLRGRTWPSLAALLLLVPRASKGVYSPTSLMSATANDSACFMSVLTGVHLEVCAILV